MRRRRHALWQREGRRLQSCACFEKEPTSKLGTKAACASVVDGIEKQVKTYSRIFLVHSFASQGKRRY